MKKSALLLCSFVSLSIFASGCKVDPGEEETDETAGVEETAEAEAALNAEAATGTVLQSLAIAELLSAVEPNDQIVQANQDGGPGCGQFSLLPGGFKMDWGTGCTTKTGAFVSGAVTVQVSKAEGNPTVTVALDLDSVTINGFDLDGTASIAPAGLGAVAIDLNLTHAGTTVVADLTLAGGLQAFTLNGTASASGSTNAQLALAGVTLALGGCFPSAGVLSFEAGVKGKLTFDQNTPATGQATLTVLGHSSCYALQSHGSCVATPCAGGEGD